MKIKATIVIAILLLTVTLQLAAQRQNLNIPDIPGYVTLKCDFHSHTVFSDGLVWPTVRIGEAYRDGLDVIAITDHIEHSRHKDYIPIDHNAAWKITKDLASEYNIILVHGAEITRSMPPGHLNALFIENADSLVNPDFMKAIEAAVKQGAFIQYNHPGWKRQQPDGIPVLYPVHLELIAKGWLNGIEYYNSEEYYPLVLEMCQKNKLAIMGNSDIHIAISEKYPVAEYPHRPVTLVFAKERTSESVREALFAGRTAVWYGDTLAGFKEFTESVFYNSIEVKAPYSSNDKTIWFEITNKSDIPFQLINGPEGAPANLTINAQSSAIVKADIRFASQPLKYDVKNIITGNGQILSVEIKVPGKK